MYCINLRWKCKSIKMIAISETLFNHEIIFITFVLKIKTYYGDFKKPDPLIPTKIFWNALAYPFPRLANPHKLRRENLLLSFSCNFCETENVSSHLNSWNPAMRWNFASNCFWCDFNNYSFSRNLFRFSSSGKPRLIKFPSCKATLQSKNWIMFIKVKKLVERTKIKILLWCLSWGIRYDLKN